VTIAALEGEISYLLRDSEEANRSRAERAFEHLNQSNVGAVNNRPSQSSRYSANPDWWNLRPTRSRTTLP
jgi:hypothetical protein